MVAVLPPRTSTRSRRCLVGLLVQPAAAHEALGDVGGLEGASLGRRMGGEVARDCDQDVAALVGCAPFLVLAHACLKHLEGMEARVLAQERVGEGGKQVLGRMVEQEIAGDEPRRRAHLLLAVERLEQGIADLGRIARQVVEPVAILAGRRAGGMLR
jgi:hypothetical protein